jgi:hypothetical protein
MGAIADAIVSFAQPLIDETDGSLEQINKAMTIGQLCWNLALVPDERLEESISEMQPSLNMDDEEFDDFRQSIIVPMIRRHCEMFPQLHRRRSSVLWLDGSSSSDPSPGGFWPGGPSLPARPRTAAPAEKYPGTDRYAPCPCDSGRKYKFCCGAKGR